MKTRQFIAVDKFVRTFNKRTLSGVVGEASRRDRVSGRVISFGDATRTTTPWTERSRSLNPRLCKNQYFRCPIA
jgi:hypothetical protein